ncbi:PAS domain S-box-containing protein [Desulfatibacillum alkenivorans DSM 16219]|jgi:PAS domain S-box-containing protein|uniref:histidine kinase n=1 Tax=Desulfatibacillum alkenivorans DSM 16219 TaxID=1121393 RepID=A0A1M6C8U2_9BACT|nr:PAS domain S-box protein [Desulfatibacillum alkenivorans]SHI57164.1 PAS domain S-box-containing protein [Desulfatibacillum alkenivorans DSM 16219]
MDPNSPRKEQKPFDQSIRYKLMLIQSVIFVIPAFAIAYFLYEKKILLDYYNALIFIFVLALILGGFILLRQILDRVADLAEFGKKVEQGDSTALAAAKFEDDELGDISGTINSLIAKLEKTTDRANQRVIELLCIKEFADAVREERNKTKLMHLLLEKAMAATGAASGAVFIRDERGSNFSLVDSRGVDPVLALDSGAQMMELVKSGEMGPGSPTFVAPLIEQDRMIGVIALGAKQGGALFTEQDQNVLSIMKDHLSSGCEAGYLDSELQDRIRELNKRTEDLEEEIRIRQETEDKLRSILESSSAISIVSTDLDQIIRYWNKGAENIFGFSAEEMVGEKITKIYVDDPQSREILSQARNHVIENKDATSCEVRELSKEGSDKWVRLNLSARMDQDNEVIGLLGIGEDITERKQLEQMLLHAQKMKAIGALAGGVAHDFNNILTSVRAYTELAQFRIDNKGAVQESLDQIMNATDRAKEMVKQILNFSRQTGEEKKPVQLGPVIKEAVTLLKAALPSTIEVVMALKEWEIIIHADATQVHQIIMNLGTNAAHAMAQSGGILHFSMIREEVDRKTAAKIPELQVGNYIKLRVQDTGCGMEPEVMKHIFDPYYTTRETGKGSGMGLAVVYGIVKQHGGAIVVKSKPGKGTLFDVYFPIVSERPKSSPRKATDIPHGTESILFVDDELAVTEPYLRILEDLGYTVTGFTDGLEALTTFKANPTHYDLIICDMTMPKITGEMLAQRAKDVRSDIPVIICTGYSDAMSEEKAGEMGIQAMLPKPLAVEELASAIRMVLEGKSYNAA